MTTLMNHAPRKSLAEQIARLDGLLDGLADAIPVAVAEAVRQSVAANMRAALTDALHRPEVLAAVAAVAERATASSHTGQPSLVQRLGSRCRAATGAVWAVTTQTVRSVANRVRTLAHAVAEKSRQASRSSVEQGRRVASAVRHGWRTLLAHINKQVQVVRLIGAITVALAGCAFSATLRLVLRQEGVVGAKLRTALAPLGHWAVPLLLVLDLVGTVVALGGGPAVTLVLALTTRLAVAALVLACCGLPFAGPSRMPTRSAI